jgi:rubredoxin
MRKFVCSVCSYVYDEAAGAPEAGVAPGTKWEDLADGWVCPVCGATKEEFQEQEAPVTPEGKVARVAGIAGELRELTPLEKSALCSNLARGCEKQYKPDEARLFAELAEYFRAVAGPAPATDFEALLALVEKDLSAKIPDANTISAEVQDRGALRALVWNEKVTRILKSLLTRYNDGNSLPDDASVFICTICGFVYVGDNPPELCPVCKAPGWKFERVEGR